jgi:hypothetical protein
MKNHRLVPLVAVVVFFAPVRVIAADIKVIANGSVKAEVISATEVKSVFLEEYNSLRDGTHVEPVLEKDGPVHEAFLREYLGGTDDDLQNYYRALVFSGRGSMPKQLDSDAEVVAYVARTKGAIGYVSAETIGEDVKTLTIVHGGNGTQRRLISQVEPEYPDTPEAPEHWGDRTPPAHHRAQRKRGGRRSVGRQSDPGRLCRGGGKTMGL